MTAPYSPFVLDPAMPREAFEQLVPNSQLTAGVGEQQPNAAADVRRVQARLRELGMTWVPDTGAIGPDPEDPTGRSIRLFLAMLDGKELWSKKDAATPADAHKQPTRKPAAIVPGSRDETWLWAANAPGWLASSPAVRDGWAPAGELNEPAMSSWLAEYLDLLGRAFRAKLILLRPVLDAVMAQGVAGLERFKALAPPVGPLDPRDPMQQTAALAARVRTDLVDYAAETHQDPAALAKKTRDALALGDAVVIPVLTAIAQPTGGLSPKHAGHQQGLECDLRLFGHAGATPTTWNVPNSEKRNPNTSLLLDGLLIECLLEQPLTRGVLHNDPVIRKRWSQVGWAKNHDDHVHLYVKGAEARTPIASHQMELECEASEADAYEAGEAETPCPPSTAIHAIADYIALVQKVERAYPQWSPDQVLAALRRIAGCDEHKFRMLFGTPEGAPISIGVGGLLGTDLCELAAMSAHRGTGGVVHDPWHHQVAIGHVLCGITAGLHRNPNVGLGSSLVVDAAQMFAGLTLDNLYATTIAGDLGQSAVRLHLGYQTTTIGRDTEATDAELIGDIDGFVLATNGALANRKLGDILAAYYSPAPPSGNAAHYSHRFRMFAPTLSAPALDEQTARFAKAYLLLDALSHLNDSTAKEVASALAELRAWYPSQLAAEVAHH